MVIIMRDTVLIVDDVEINRALLGEILKEDYDILEASNGEEAISIIETNLDEISIMLLDIVMPGMDGFDVLRAMQYKGWINKIPVLIISGERSYESERIALQFGASDFIRKPFDRVLVTLRVGNIVEISNYRHDLEKKVEEQTNMLREQAQILARRNDKIIDVLGTVVESRNLESGEHIFRVKEYTRILAYHMMECYPECGLTPALIRMISQASSLHDVGKIAIPDSVLLKPGRLTDEEFSIMKEHTTRGCELLDSLDTDIWDEKYGKLSYEICRYHHERFDGRGYPDRLKGDEIPISAQLVSVADVYDALVHDRVYRKAINRDKAFNMILNGECGVFSPKLIECLKQAREEFEKI